MPDEATEDVRAICEAMERLYWDVRDLYIACFQYGDIGTEADLRAHLEDGRHLRPSQHIILVVAINEALMAQGDSHRI